MPKPKSRHIVRAFIAITSIVALLTLALAQTLYFGTNSYPTWTTYSCATTCTQLATSQDISQPRCIEACGELIGLTETSIACQPDELFTLTCQPGEVARCTNGNSVCQPANTCWLPWANQCLEPTLENCYGFGAVSSQTQCSRNFGYSRPSTTSIINNRYPSVYQISQAADVAACHRHTTQESCQTDISCRSVFEADTFIFCQPLWTSYVNPTTSPQPTSKPNFFTNLIARTGFDFDSLRSPAYDTFVRDSVASTQLTPAEQLFFTTQLQARSIIVDGIKANTYTDYFDFLTWLATTHQVASVGLDGTLTHTPITNPGKFRNQTKQNPVSNYPSEAALVYQFAQTHRDPFTSAYKSTEPVPQPLTGLDTSLLASNAGARHFSPHYQYLDTYLKLLHQQFTQLAQLPNTTARTDLLTSLATYLQLAIVAQPFDQLNTEVFTNQTNTFLELHGLKGAPLGLLEFAAQRLSTDSFIRFYSDWILANQ